MWWGVEEQEHHDRLLQQDNEPVGHRESQGPFEGCWTGTSTLCLLSLVGILGHWPCGGSFPAVPLWWWRGQQWVSASLPRHYLGNARKKGCKQLTIGAQCLYSFAHLVKNKNPTWVRPHRTQVFSQVCPAVETRRFPSVKSCWTPLSLQLELQGSSTRSPAARMQQDQHYPGIKQGGQWCGSLPHSAVA